MFFATVLLGYITRIGDKSCNVWISSNFLSKLHDPIIRDKPQRKKLKVCDFNTDHRSFSIYAGDAMWQGVEWPGEEAE
jgi:hypothetical protein